MTGLVAAVRAKLDRRCLATGRLNKSGCGITMKDAPQPRVVVDFDKPGAPARRDGPRCDYLFIAEGGDGCFWVAPLELKKGRLHAGEIVSQLRAGAETAERLVPSGEKAAFRPIVAAGGIPKAERNELKKADNKVRFHGRREEVRLMQCGAPLVRALCP